MFPPLLALLLVLLTLPAAAQLPGNDFTPQRTWVFLVGVLEWRDRVTWPSFSKKNRRDVRLQGAFARLGVPEDHIRLLQDRQATCRAVRQQFQEFVAHVPQGDTLVVYYAGHGYRASRDGTFWMVPYDGFDVNTLWGLDWLGQQLDRAFHGDRVLLSADCCYSGALLEYAARGGHRFALAAFSSAPADQQSTGNWTFSDCLLDGLRGSPVADANGDGVVTLGEIGSLIAQTMRSEGQSAGLQDSPGFPAASQLVVVARPRLEGEGELVRVRYDGNFWKARVVERGSKGVLVHWIGLEKDYPDEWVHPEQVRPITIPTRARWRR